MANLDFSTAELVRVLDSNERLKYLAFLVKMSSAGNDRVDTVILAEKTSFTDSSELVNLLQYKNPSDCGIHMKLRDFNDVYYRYLIQINGIDHAKLTIIHPATAKHIAKYTSQQRFIVEESPEIYETIVLPYIQKNPASRLQWVQNILEEKSEMEILIHADRDPLNGFYLLPDSKWDRRTLTGLYLLAICKDPGIRSLRDLDGHKHMPLLVGIKKAVEEVVPVKYPGIQANQLRCFIHYQPTYYHFHVHIVHVDMVDGAGALVGQAHLLDDVIDNLKTFGPDYYARKTLHYQLGGNHELYTLLNATASK